MASSLNLAFLGDAVYELFVRESIVKSEDGRVNTLNKHATELSKALTQAAIADILIKDNYLSEEELTIYKRGRNAKSVSVPKSCTPAQYRKATGLESLVGYLHLNGNNKRIREILEYGIGKYHESEKA